MSSVLESGLVRYFSEVDLAKLQSARIGIAGVGGLGSNCAMLLVRSGVKQLYLADFDVVSPSNLNRQFYFPPNLGQLKVEALAGNLLQLEPALELTLNTKQMDVLEITTFFAGCDIVVEALDDPAQKALLCQSLLLSTECFVVGASGMGGISGATMSKRKLGERFVCVGDFTSAVTDGNPPFAPRVMQAAALEAECVLEYILSR